jgi:hypothetical protein
VEELFGPRDPGLPRFEVGGVKLGGWIVGLDLQQRPRQPGLLAGALLAVQQVSHDRRGRALQPQARLVQHRQQRVNTHLPTSASIA